MNKNAAFTVIAQNYVGYGVVLAESMKMSNPDVDFFIYFADGVCDEICSMLHDKGIHFVDATNTEDAEVFLSMAFRYEITEYCTAIKPFIISQIFDQGYDTATYIDPDIYVYQSLAGAVFHELANGASIVLTPHICSPITDALLPGEQEHLKTGTYNLGFTSVKNDETGRMIADWWAEKCRNACFNDSASGLFVDQKWMNLVPGMFPNVCITRNPGLNMAYWNLHERSIDGRLVNGQEPLIFFHFSGFIAHDINVISKYQNRYTLVDRPDLRPLFEDYRKSVTQVLAGLAELPKYKYNYYSNGMAVSLLARRFYHFKQNDFECPFKSIDSERAFIAFLNSNGVYEKSINDGISSPSDINRKAKLFNKAMRILLRVFGPHRYVSLCRYFGFISSLHQQYFLLNEYKNLDVVDEGRSHIKR